MSLDCLKGIRAEYRIEDEDIVQFANSLAQNYHITCRRRDSSVVLDDNVTLKNYAGQPVSLTLSENRYRDQFYFKDKMSGMPLGNFFHERYSKGVYSESASSDDLVYIGLTQHPPIMQDTYTDLRIEGMRIAMSEYARNELYYMLEQIAQEDNKEDMDEINRLLQELSED